MATSVQKSSYRYSDYYCYMSLKDFNAYISRDDDEGDSSFPISKNAQITWHGEA